MVPPVRHACSLDSTEQAAPRHRPVRQGGGEEDLVHGLRGDAGECVEGLTGLWKNA